MATLALPAPTSADTDAKASLARAIQVVEQLEDSLHELHGVGVISGGVVSIVSGFTCSIASGTKIYQEGYVYELGSAQEFTAANPSATEYVWATVEVTRADPQEPTEEDSYALTVSTNTTGTPPSSLHVCLAVLTNGALAVTSVADPASGKYLQTRPLRATATWDPASMADGAVVSTTIAVTGAQVGDAVSATLSTLGTNNVLISAHVQAAGTVRVTLLNKTGGALDLASGTLKVLVWKW